MPNLKWETKGRVLVVEEKDSMGRSTELAEQMAKNDPKPPSIGPTTRQYQTWAAVEYAKFPKVMYRLAVDENGLPNGDLVSPGYPLPFDLAVSLGVDTMGFPRINQTFQSQGHFLVRHPYETTLVPIGFNWNHPIDIDVKECEKQEKALIAAGWVDHLSKIPELQRPEIVVSNDPLKPLPEVRKRSPKIPSTQSVKQVQS